MTRSIFAIPDNFYASVQQKPEVKEGYMLRFKKTGAKR